MNEDGRRPAAPTPPMAGIDGDVLCLYCPQQVLPAMAAEITYRRRHAIDPGRTLHVLLWSAATHDGHRTNRRTVVETLLGGFPWVPLWTPSAMELDRDLSPRRSVAAKASDLRRRFDGAEIGAIFYPHDLTSDFLPLAMGRAFPRARRVCFGDGLGLGGASTAPSSSWARSPSRGCARSATNWPSIVKSCTRTCRAAVTCS